ncbi:MAG TPA: tripartite tricarboxylate transporter substrate binding protein [Burkholderiales bacterium]|jgi:tripartite-type tricarboxylate transporter receptor subunit TctC|nr:tripartite tricarboxylate transporter substrate binding protein [Burkholderiales bacterium]
MKYRLLHAFALAAGAGFTCTAAAQSAAQTYPSKPIRIIAPGSGGSGDFAARLIAQGMSASLGQQVIVENRSGIIPAEIVAKAPPDGYTLLLHGSTIWLTPLLQDNVSYDPARDFSPIALTNRSPNILVVHPAVPARSVMELIALAKARPGELNYSSGSIGGSSFLAPELFKAMTGAKIVRIAYKGDTQEITDLISGNVQLTFGAVAALTPHIKSGRLRALAVTSAERSALFPGLPTIAASGLPGYEAVSILGVWAPAGTPVMLIDRLNHEIVEVFKKSDVKERFLIAGVETVGSSPQQFAAKIKSETIKWGKVFKDAGIRVE